MAVEFALLGWENGSPLNVRFGDIYFSRRGALEEVDEVFIGGNRLPERWRGCRSFVVGETGFGTGLNFFLTVARWLELAPPDAVLHYFTVEKNPLSPDDMRAVAAAWPMLASYVEELVASLFPLVPGYQRRYLFRGRVILTLGIGEAATLLNDCAGKVDAWYLDGFAPRKNPDMWDDGVLGGVARLSKSGTTFSTFTAAGDVRRRLTGFGFAVSKVPGYGGKRERLQGAFQGGALPALSSPPWFATPPPVDSRHAVVIGAGIAGLSVATALARRGWEVTVLEGRDGPGGGASGGPASIVAPKLTGGGQASAQFLRRSFAFSAPWYEQLQATLGDIGWRRGGLIDCAAPDATDEALEPFLERIDGAEVGQRCGAAIAGSKSPAAFIPSAGWVFSRQLLRALGGGYAAIDLRHGCEVAQLRPAGDAWHALDSRGNILAQSDCVILAQGWTPRGLWPGGDLPMRAVGGQLSELSAAGPWRDLKCAVRGEVHVVPLGEGRVVVGATYVRDEVSDHSSVAGHEANLAGLAGQPFAWEGRLSHVTGGWSSTRLASRDYLPVVGPAADAAFFQTAYSDLHHGKAPGGYPPAQYLPGLYALTALGSHGFVTAPLAAELVADYVTGTPVCVDRADREAIHPARFMIKRLKRRSECG